MPIFKDILLPRDSEYVENRDVLNFKSSKVAFTKLGEIT
jgi:hypothetical protein